jgi:hypothetical protein
MERDCHPVIHECARRRCRLRCGAGAGTAIPLHKLLARAFCSAISPSSSCSRFAVLSHENPDATSRLTKAARAWRDRSAHILANADAIGTASSGVHSTSAPTAISFVAGVGAATNSEPQAIASSG